MSANPLLTAAQVRDILVYDPETGAFHWRANFSRKIRAGARAGSDNGGGYIVIRINGKGFKAHRLAWLYVHGEWPADQIDHINCNPSDNRIVNLREATKRLNAQNRRAAVGDTATGVLGVRRCRGRYAAAIVHNGQRSHLGVFDTVQEAHEAYVHAKRELHEGCSI